MRAWALLAALALGCVPDPPGVDEVLCGWERVEWWEASGDTCIKVVGSEHLKPTDDACAAPKANACVVLKPGESTWLYTDTSIDIDATVTEGDCAELTCP